MHFTHRSEDDAGLSRQNTIIIAVCASVGGLALLALSARFIQLRLARSASRSAPLPPVQPLAHHREQQLARFYASQHHSTTYGPAHLGVPHDDSSTASFRGSKTSLLGGPPDSLSTISRHVSSSMGCDTAEDISLASPMAVNDLELPNPIFHGHSGSSYSVASDRGRSETPVSSSSLSLSDTGPHSAGSSPGSSQSRTPSRSRRPRPLSMTSTSTSYSKSSRATIRTHGPPHAHHNNIQIMLPAPLAPGLQTSYARPTLVDTDDFGRMSVADQWTPKTYRSEGSYGMDHRTRAASNGGPQSSISAQSSSRNHLPASQLKQPRRVNSALSSELSSPTTPSSSSSVGPNSLPYNNVPPVPRVPSRYNSTVVEPKHYESSVQSTPEHRVRPPAPPFAVAPRASSVPSPRGNVEGFVQDESKDAQSSDNRHERR